MDRHPENGGAHFALSYVLRNGGAIDESARECDAALALDAGDYGLRSCSMTFDQLGNNQRAMDFFKLDAGSSWASNHLMRYYIREGKLPQAREAIQKNVSAPYAQMMTACIDGSPPGKTADFARGFSDQVLADSDPEVRYWFAPDFAFCGHRDLGLSLLKSAIVTGHYCAYDGLQNDSVFAPCAARRSSINYSTLRNSARLISLPRDRRRADLNRYPTSTSS